MSASDKKKLHKEEKLAKLTERQLKEQKEAKQLKRNSVLFVVAIALVLCIGIGLIGYNWYNTSGLPERTTTAITIGEHKLSAAELNYYYIDILNSLSQDWYSTYLLQMEGLQTTVALDQQMYNEEEGKTWADYFIDEAIGEAAGILALCDKANAAGFALSAEEKATIESTLTSIETQAKENGFGSLNDYLKALYGNGAQVKTFRTYLENSTLAQSYYDHHIEGLSYTADDLAAKDQETPGYFSSYDYTYYTLSLDDFMTHESEEEHNHSEEDKAEALKKAEEIAKELVASGATNKEELDKAIAALEMYQTEEVTEETTEETTEEATEETTEEATEETETTTEGAEATEETTEETTEEATAETTAPTTEEVTEENTEETTEETEKETTEEETEDDTIEITTGEAEEDGEEGTTEETTTSSAPTSTSRTDYDYGYIPTEIAEWLAGEGRKVGEIGYVPYYATDDEGEATEEVEGYYVVILDAEDKREEKLVSARHILVKFVGGSVDEETGDTVYSDEDKAATKAEAEKILAEYEAGAKTAEAFGELAKKYSEDNADEGGLYEDIYPGQMETGFEDWCFDEARKTGDTGIVETSYGYHVMYFVETQEETYRDYLIENELRNEEANDWFVELRDGYKNVAKIGNLSFLNTSIVLSN